MTKDKIAITVAIVAILAGGGYWTYQKYGSTGYDGSEDGVACTQEARSCPDGSYVGRVPPTCEFAPCPGGETPLPPQQLLDTSNPALSGVEGWQTYRNDEYGFEVKYPPDWSTETLGVTYDSLDQIENLLTVSFSSNEDLGLETPVIHLSIRGGEGEKYIEAIKKNHQILTSRNKKVHGLEWTILEIERFEGVGLPAAPRQGFSAFTVADNRIIVLDSGSVELEFNAMLSTFKFIK